MLLRLNGLDRNQSRPESRDQMPRKEEGTTIQRPGSAYDIDQSLMEINPCWAGVYINVRSIGHFLYAS